MNQKNQDGFKTKIAATSKVFSDKFNEKLSDKVFRKKLSITASYVFVFAVVAFLMTGCNSPGALDQAGNGDATINAADLTFAKDIAPLIDKNCVSCHNSQNGIAPFSLETYTDVKNHAASVRFAIENRTMPPPGVDNSGSCQKFSNHQWLSDQEIEIVSKWTDNGAPSGDLSKITSVPPPIVGIGTPDLTLRMAEPYTPAPDAGEIDDYRCFLIDPQQTQDQFITAFEVQPGEDRVVHHIIVFKPASAGAQTDAEAQDAASAEPGYPCFGAAGVPASVVGLWAPGGSGIKFKDPETDAQLGIPLEAGRKLIMQVHYNTQKGVFPDQTELRLNIAQNNVKPVRWILFADFLMQLDPGQANVVSEDTQSIAEMLFVNEVYETGNIPFPFPSARDMKFYAVAPHMHTLGKSLKISKKISGAADQCMADAPLFDFNWQNSFTYTKPISIDEDDEIKISCNFNTSQRTETINFGEGTLDEMCLAFFLASDE